MSRHYSTHSHRVQDLVKQVINVDPADWYTQFDIDQDENGDIFDVLYEKTFVSLLAWAEYQIQMEQDDEDDRNYNYRFDDE